MRYLCLIYDRAARAHGGRAAAHGSPDRAWEASRSWQVVAPPGEGVTVRLEDDQLCVIEGSIAVDGDPAPGFLIVEAIDLNDAIRIVSAHPAVSRGWAELRPITPSIPSI